MVFLESLVSIVFFIYCRVSYRIFVGGGNNASQHLLPIPLPGKIVILETSEIPFKVYMYFDQKLVLTFVVEKYMYIH